MSREPHANRAPRERVIVCGVLFPDFPEETEGPLTEARGLIQAAGSEVVGEGIFQRRQKAIAATLLGSGKVLEVKEAIDQYKPDAVVVDNDLSPAQGRNLEKAWGVRIIDRSELILDIFARRAQTRQASLQVELAQHEYLMPRLRRMWTHLERTEGAIGTRGPGETQLETDRRLINKRIHDLREQLHEIERRKRRQVVSRAERFTIGLIGYTNAGKSTLLNRLTGSDVLAEDMLFATLDTRTRRWKLGDGREVLLTDTVGFLRRLPHHLVASFHATLEEALNVDLLLHVVDASHPDAPDFLAAVDEVVLDSGATHRDQILVLNKIDQCRDPLHARLLARDRDEQHVLVSAYTGAGVDELTSLVADRLDRRSALVEIEVPFTSGASLAILRQAAAILDESHDAVRGTLLRARVPDRELGNLRRRAGPNVVINVLEPAVERYYSGDLAE
ncbi:GTPase HflX [Engelhardtia mirabilis]|uniref:GTPase HflX n=1 Tax=Engelhardtia mirabilis TaxID=2528011 RepID=A0A518BPH6_9BACT|nr:GTPase HflX [Planctomycetes bacterium Pla133]QDV03204.1 GTPase HflX [Planctomycetes bacterium Pla86]